MQQQQQQTIALEAFEASLRGTNMLWYLLDERTIYPPGFTDQIFADGAPFSRRILIASGDSLSAKKSQSMRSGFCFSKLTAFGFFDK